MVVDGPEVAGETGVTHHYKGGVRYSQETKKATGGGAGSQW
jgi:hypothetical protein